MTIDHRPRDPEAWDIGCARDMVRNELVIPHLRELLRRSGARSVIDIGCGSGYIAREVARGLEQSVAWRLIDVDQDTLAYAVRSMSDEHDVQELLIDLTCPAVEGAMQAPFAFAAFTLLEFPMTQTVATNLAAFVDPGGILALYMPDVLADVERAELTTPGLLRRYQRGHCELPKLDKFTQRDYAFHANRLEFIIRDLGAAGLHLVGLDRLPRQSAGDDADGSIFCLRFIRPAEHDAA